MSGGCGCGQPVILNNPAAGQRVDVEGSLLCDVLADGTIAGQALVEAVYDASSGQRIGQRIVDPATGATYPVQGTLQPCPPPEQCSCETVLLCHTPETPIPGPTTSPVPLTATGQPTTHTISGAPRQGMEADATAIWAGQTVSIPGAAPGASDVGAHTHYTVALAPGTPDCGTLDPTGTVEITATVTYTNNGPGGGWDWYGRLSLWVEGAAAPVAADNFGQGSGVFFSAGQTRTATITGTVPVAALQAGDVSVEFDLETGPNGAAPEGTDPKTWTVTGASVTAVAAVTGCTSGSEAGDPVPFLRHICRTCSGTATVTSTLLDGTTAYDTTTGTVGLCGQESAGRQVIERCGCDQTASGIIRYIELWSVDTSDPEADPLLLGTWQDGDFTRPYEPVNPIDCPASGPEEVAAPIVLGHICYDDGTSVRTAAVVRCAGCDDTTVRYVDVETGAEVTTPTAVPCPADPACASPTTPVTSVGLCLADGTPIAVTITRDCTGATVSEGWLNLATGAWTAGAVPAGTVACGDSRSIQVSGTFCAVDDTTGDVTALVLVEYTYDDTGAISAVRLVDAITGGDYVPPAGVTVTTCPAGVAQPEQDIVHLCNVAADGTVTQFIRDYRRDENGAIVGHSDYLLDGSDYDPPGTVGVCPSPCLSTHAEVLCDSAPQTLALTTTYRPLTEAPIDTVANEIDLGPDLGQQLWDGQTVTIGPTTGVHDLTYAVGALGADCPGCGQPDDEVAVTVSLDVTFNGPATGAGSTGGLQMLNGTASLGAVATPSDTAVGWSGTLTLTRTVPLADLRDGQVKVRLGLETSQDGSKTWTVTGWTATAQRAAAGCGRQFLRTYIRDCVTGEITDTLDTTLDGADYSPVGEVARCTSPEPCDSRCSDCETLLLCADDPATITGQGVSSGTLSNGVSWQVKGNYSTIGSSHNNADGAWWGNPASFPNVAVPPYQFTFSRPSVVEFSVYMGVISPPTESDDNCTQLPAGLEVVSLPNGFVYNPATGLLCVNGQQPADPTGTNLGNPTRAISARFRTPNPISTLVTRYYGPRRAIGGSFRTSWVGAIEVTPTTQFLRRICRDCTGTVTSTTDTLLDGTTPYDPPGEVMACEPSQDQPPGADTEPLLLCHTAADGVTVTPFLRHITYDASTGAVSGLKDTRLDGVTAYTIGTGPTAGTVSRCECCEPVPVCVATIATGEVEFVSNPDKDDTGEVESTWTWTPAVGDDPSAATTWWPMYRKTFGPAWATVDSPTRADGTPNTQTAGWVSPHPDARISNTGRAGEGPTLANPSFWWARADFSLPEAADPDSIKVEITALNADQVPVRYRLNDGPWISGGGSYTSATPYKQPPQTVTGAQPGQNYLYFEVEENAAIGPASNGAGVIAHFILTYEIPQLGQRSWTQMVCCDGSVYYLDETGTRHDSLPEDMRVVPCSTPSPVVLCDDAGPFLRHVLYAGDRVVGLDTTLTGESYAPVGTVTSCGGDGTTVSGRQLVERCGCDQGPDGLVRYVELWSVDPDGAGTPALVGTYLDGDFDQPYEPVNPIDCPADAGGDGCALQVVERCRCDDTDGDGLPDARYVELWAVDPCGGAAPALMGTYSADDLAVTYAPVSPVDCTEDSATPASVLTGTRAVTGTTMQNLVTEFPNLQSVTLMVTAGTALATTSSGSAVPIPAGASVTWSVSGPEDGALAAASFAGADASTSYLLVWTYKA